MYDFHMMQYGQTDLAPDYDWNFKATPVHIFHYILNGTCEYHYNDHTVKARPGWLYIIPQLLPCTANLVNNSNLNHLFFGFFYNKIYNSNKIIEIEVEKYPTLKSTLGLLSDYISIQCFTDFKYQDHALHVAELFNFLLYILGSHNLLPFIDDTRIGDSLAYIHSHFHEDITVQDISAAVNLCAGHFTQLFKAVMMVSPYQYLKQVRLTAAIRLIQSGVSVSAAAIACGYQSVYSLSAAIKNFTTISPTHLKKY